MNAALTPFVMELQMLESDNGVNVTINNKPYTLRASLAGVIADTLAAHVWTRSPIRKLFLSTVHAISL